MICAIACKMYLGFVLLEGPLHVSGLQVEYRPLGRCFRRPFFQQPHSRALDLSIFSQLALCLRRGQNQLSGPPVTVPRHPFIEQSHQACYDFRSAMLHIAESIGYSLGANVEAPQSRLLNGYGLTAGSAWGLMHSANFLNSSIDLNCSVHSLSTL